MPRTRKINQLPATQRKAVARAIIEGRPSRAIAGQAGVGKSSVQRYKKDVLPKLAAEAMAFQRLDTGEAILDYLNTVKARIEKLYNACDKWLEDPDHPGTYTLDPRANEIQVIYQTIDPDTSQPIRKRAQLDDLLWRIDQDGYQPWHNKFKVKDPRELILHTAKELRGFAELVAHILGEYKEGEQVTIQMVVLQFTDALEKVLKPHPKALAAVRRMIDGLGRD
jgi:hypothetical protein